MISIATVLLLAFRPEAYSEAITAAVEGGYQAIIVDSVSHEHAGEGGLLDWHDEELDRMAGNDWANNFMDKLFSVAKPQLRKERLNAISKLASLGEFDIVIPQSESQAKRAIV